MNSKIIPLIICIALFIGGCDANKEEDGSTNTYNNSDILIVDDDLFLYNSEDKYEIVNAFITNHSLHLIIQYSGGCG